MRKYLLPAALAVFPLSAVANPAFEATKAGMIKNAEAELEIQKKNLACLQAATGPEAVFQCGQERSKAMQAQIQAQLAAMPPAIPSGAPAGGAAPGFPLPKPGATSLILPKYEDAAFKKAVAAGQPVVLVFSKADCPSCLQQVPHLKSLLAEKDFRKLKVFQVDFVKSPELAKQHNVMAWTTVLLFKGGKEVSRSWGLTDKEMLRNELGKIK